MKITEEKYKQIMKEIEEYDINNPTLDDDFNCPLYPNVNLHKLCKILNYYPHPMQQFIIKNMKRFTILNNGRQS